MYYLVKLPNKVFQVYAPYAIIELKFLVTNQIRMSISNKEDDS